MPSSGSRPCPRCGRPRERKRSAYCRACAAAWQRDYRRRRDWRFGRGYRLRVVDFHLLVQANGGCGVCGSQEGVVVDHDHKTGKVRGVLCRHCNFALGHVGDSPARLRALASYLERPTAKVIGLEEDAASKPIEPVEEPAGN